MEPWSEGRGAATPGWYPDPEQPSLVRYWDGERWSPHTAPAPAHAIGVTVPAAPTTNGMAIASLVCGVASFAVCGITAVLGIVFGHIARRQLRASGGRETGEGLALAGLIVSYAVVALVVLGIVVVLGAAANLRT